jgi:hypothetical protein
MRTGLPSGGAVGNPNVQALLINGEGMVTDVDGVRALVTVLFHSLDFYDWFCGRVAAVAVVPSLAGADCRDCHT